MVVANISPLHNFYIDSIQKQYTCTYSNVRKPSSAIFMH